MQAQAFSSTPLGHLPVCRHICMSMISTHCCYSLYCVTAAVKQISCPMWSYQPHSARDIRHRGYCRHAKHSQTLPTCLISKVCLKHTLI